ncbi:unnamed protein product [Gordionus sp. m RMFG-2023]
MQPLDHPLFLSLLNGSGQKLNYHMKLIFLALWALAFCHHTLCHLRLTFPLPRKLSTDFMHENPPCGNTVKSLVPFPLKRKNFYKITWDVTHSLPGLIKLQLLDSQGNLVYNISETSCSNGSMHVQSLLWTVPDTMNCPDCILRLSQNVELHGQNYNLYSCADVSISSNYTLLCYNRGYPVNGKCLCRQLNRGEYCQFENECEDQEDCGGGKRGSCKQYSRTYFPQKMCYCHHGFYMSKCSAKSDINRFAFSPDKALTLGYESHDLCPNCPLKMFWKILEDTCEIEIVLMGPINMQIGLGWRWNNFTTLCRNFPFYMPSFNDNSLDPFECLDVVTGQAHGNSLRVEDRYAQTSFASPEMDTFYGSSSDDFGSAMATESLFHLFVIFTKKIGGYSYINRPIHLKVPDNFRNKRQVKTDSNFTSPINLDVAESIQKRESNENKYTDQLYRADPFDIPIIDGPMHLAWGLYPESKGARFNFGMIDENSKGFVLLDMCKGKCDKCRIKKERVKETNYFDQLNDNLDNRIIDVDSGESRLEENSNVEPDQENNAEVPYNKNYYERRNVKGGRDDVIKKLLSKNKNITYIEKNINLVQLNNKSSLVPKVNDFKKLRKEENQGDKNESIVIYKFRNSGKEPTIEMFSKFDFESNIFDMNDTMKNKLSSQSESVDLISPIIRLNGSSKMYKYFVSPDIYVLPNAQSQIFSKLYPLSLNGANKISPIKLQKLNGTQKGQEEPPFSMYSTKKLKDNKILEDLVELETFNFTDHNKVMETDGDNEKISEKLERFFKNHTTLGNVMDPSINITIFRNISSNIKSNYSIPVQEEISINITNITNFSSANTYTSLVKPVDNNTEIFIPNNITETILNNGTLVSSSSPMSELNETTTLSSFTNISNSIVIVNANVTREDLVINIDEATIPEDQINVSAVTTKMFTQNSFSSFNSTTFISNKSEIVTSNNMVINNNSELLNTTKILNYTQVTLLGNFSNKTVTFPPTRSLMIESIINELTKPPLRIKTLGNLNDTFVNKAVTNKSLYSKSSFSNTIFTNNPSINDYKSNTTVNFTPISTDISNIIVTDDVIDILNKLEDADISLNNTEFLENHTMLPNDYKFDTSELVYSTSTDISNKIVIDDDVLVKKLKATENSLNISIISLEPSTKLLSSKIDEKEESEKFNFSKFI